MPVTATLRRLVVGAAVAVTALSAASACSAEPDEPQQLDDWHVIALPDGMAASTLLPTRESLLVGGSRPVGDGRAPALAGLPLDGTDVGPSVIPLTPATPYGKVADLVSLTGDEDSLTALGAAHGGAHANFRWTIWSGTADGVTDQPQTFETFGGWEAGTLLGLAGDSRGPLVVGTWQGAHGADGAIWRAAGDRWVRQRAEPTWTSTTTRQVGPRTVEQGVDGGVLVSGSVIDLSDGVHQGAAYWRDVDGSWTLTRLTDPGDRSEAWSTTCGGVCWSVGRR
ncbi:MAG TPA: hypothetical protein VFU98_09380, partial [Microlunatus sp.]|nr:hypothetical protein [Microlunatus sp.]